MVGKAPQQQRLGNPYRHQYITSLMQV